MVQRARRAELCAFSDASVASHGIVHTLPEFIIIWGWGGGGLDVRTFHIRALLRFFSKGAQYVLGGGEKKDTRTVG